MAILPYRASMQRLMIKLLRIPERIDRLMSVRFKFQNAKTDQASNSRIPESKGSSSFRILGCKERLRFEFPESKDWSSFEFPGCKDRAEIRIQGNSQDWYSGWRQRKKSVQDTTKWYRSSLQCSIAQELTEFEASLEAWIFSFFFNDGGGESSKIYWIKKAQRLLPKKAQRSLAFSTDDGSMTHPIAKRHGSSSSFAMRWRKLKDYWIKQAERSLASSYTDGSMTNPITNRHNLSSAMRWRKLKDYYNSVKKAQRWLASSTVTGSMAPPTLQNRSLWTHPKINLQQSVFENHTLMR